MQKEQLEKQAVAMAKFEEEQVRDLHVARHKKQKFYCVNPNSVGFMFVGTEQPHYFVTADENPRVLGSRNR